MTDSDERLLTAAKLREQVRGRIDGNDRLHPHVAIAPEDHHGTTLSFLEGLFDDDLPDDLDLEATSFAGTELGHRVTRSFETKAATEAVHSGNASVLSYLVGITEQDLDGGHLRLPLLIGEALENDGAPAFVVAGGNPNSGKTNTVSLLIELRDLMIPDLQVLSNVRSWKRTDTVVTNAHDLAVALLEDRDRPKAIVVDESSTHFDARTYRNEVPQQWTPLAKRFAKVGVDVCVNVIHTGKDFHPEGKRLATLPFLKYSRKEVEFFDEWPADSDVPRGSRYTGNIENLEPTTVEYDPDDAAPWSWNLRADLFAKDLSWSELLRELRKLGPAEV